MERRYHLRYYKTATCVHETDTRGYCVKNGPHCAFAHGPLDLRQPVYDVRELQAIDKEESEVGQTGLENNKAVLEDPRWQGSCCTYCTVLNVHKSLLHLHKFLVIYIQQEYIKNLFCALEHLETV